MLRRAFCVQQVYGFCHYRSRKKFPSSPVLPSHTQIHSLLALGFRQNKITMEPGVGLNFLFLLIFISGSCSCSSNFYLLSPWACGLIPDTCGGGTETSPTWNTCFQSFQSDRDQSTEDTQWKNKTKEQKCFISITSVEISTGLMI